MGRHDAVDAGFHDGLERHEFKLHKLAEVVIQYRQLQMGIHSRIAMTWEVFGASQHTFCCKALLESTSQRRDGGSVFSPCPHIDDRVGWVVVDIADGC